MSDTTNALDPVRLTVLCGNPRAQSRTLEAASRVADSLARHARANGVAVHRTVLDLAPLAGEVFADQRPNVSQALATTVGSDLLVVATPVYKGSYTGLLKAFLDWLPYRALAGTVAVPLTVMAQPVHAMVADTHLRPLLVELGARTPTDSVVLTEESLGGETALRWAMDNADAALAAVRRALGEGVPA